MLSHDFSLTMDSLFEDIVSGNRDVAVAVSGGADSMALCFLLSGYFSRNAANNDNNVNIGSDANNDDNNKVKIHALTVDHGLRHEAADEALHVAEQLSSLSNVKHSVLKWGHENEIPESRIQELARRARYDLMAEYMKDHALSHLFLAHHLDDQAETFLFRLSKGSGLDGLASMLPRQNFCKSSDSVHRSDNIGTGQYFELCRPLLNTPKAELITYCDQHKIPYIDDPSNDSHSFARVRIRKSIPSLAKEGLTPKRLAVTAKRMARARKALDEISAHAFEDILKEKETGQIVFDSSRFMELPEEVGLRVLLLAMRKIAAESGIAGEYGPRLEKVESIITDLMKLPPFRKRTLYGMVFERNDKQGRLIICLESKNADGVSG